MWIRPFKNVPVVMTTAPHRSSRPLAVMTPAAAPSSTIRSSTGSAVGLRARPLHCWPLRPVQHAELDARLVDHAAHEPVERIDFAHKVPLAKSANGRIARHLADGLELMRDERRPRAHARSRSRRFAPSVPATHNNDVEQASHCVQTLTSAKCR